MSRSSRTALALVSAGAALAASPLLPLASRPPAAARHPHPVAHARRGHRRPGRRLVPAGPAVVGLASWYTGTGRTADGERLRPGALTAASPTVPFGTRLRVCRAGRCIVVRVNDRGPYTGGRILDLTLAGATDLGYRSAGTARVSVTRLREVVAG